MAASETAAAASAARGRLLMVAAALIWSTSGAFTKALTRDTWLGLNEPAIEPLTIAGYRVLFAAAVLLPLLRRRDLSWRPLMAPMALCFALMNVLFVTALATGTAGTAIFLQYTAPMWMFAASVWWLGEPADRRSLAALGLGLAGIAVIVAGGWRDARLDVVGMGLGSGLAYAAVVICIRALRGASSLWLTALNHLLAGLLLLPWLLSVPLPTFPQLVWLFLYGGVQMAIPYWLMARGLRSLSPQEAGIITLLEPVLNPTWAYLLAGESESPFTLAGGGVIVAALAWRYWPRGRSQGL